MGHFGVRQPSHGKASQSVCESLMKNPRVTSIDPIAKEHRAVHLRFTEICDPHERNFTHLIFIVPSLKVAVVNTTREIFLSLGFARMTHTHVGRL